VPIPSPRSVTLTSSAASGNQWYLNGNPIGGVQVITRNGWFAARPSGTEDVYKIYAESFLGREHLTRIQEEAQALVGGVLSALVGS